MYVKRLKFSGKLLIYFYRTFAQLDSTVAARQMYTRGLVICITSSEYRSTKFDLTLRPLLSGVRYVYF